MLKEKQPVDSKSTSPDILIDDKVNQLLRAIYEQDVDRTLQGLIQIYQYQQAGDLPPSILNSVYEFAKQCGHSRMQALCALLPCKHEPIPPLLEAYAEKEARRYPFFRKIEHELRDTLVIENTVMDATKKFLHLNLSSQKTLVITALSDSTLDNEFKNIFEMLGLPHHITKEECQEIIKKIILNLPHDATTTLLLNEIFNPPFLFTYKFELLDLLLQSTDTALLTEVVTPELTQRMLKLLCSISFQARPAFTENFKKYYDLLRWFDVDVNQHVSDRIFTEGEAFLIQTLQESGWHPGKLLIKLRQTDQKAYEALLKLVTNKQVFQFMFFVEGCYCSNFNLHQLFYLPEINPNFYQDTIDLALFNGWRSIARQMHFVGSYYLAESQQTTMVTDLNDDILELIAKYLPPKDFRAWKSSCKRLRESYQLDISQDKIQTYYLHLIDELLDTNEQIRTLLRHPSRSFTINKSGGFLVAYALLFILLHGTMIHGAMCVQHTQEIVDTYTKQINRITPAYCNKDFGVPVIEVTFGTLFSLFMYAIAIGFYCSSSQFIDRSITPFTKPAQYTYSLFNELVSELMNNISVLVDLFVTLLPNLRGYQNNFNQLSAVVKEIVALAISFGSSLEKEKDFTSIRFSEIREDGMFERMHRHLTFFRQELPTRTTIPWTEMKRVHLTQLRLFAKEMEVNTAETALIASNNKHKF